MTKPVLDFSAARKRMLALAAGGVVVEIEGTELADVVDSLPALRTKVTMLERFRSAGISLRDVVEECK